MRNYLPEEIISATNRIDYEQGINNLFAAKITATVLVLKQLIYTTHQNKVLYLKRATVHRPSLTSYSIFLDVIPTYSGSFEESTGTFCK